MCEDVDRIFKISLSKIKHTKPPKLYGKSNLLHRAVLVNTVINRVKNSENKSSTQKHASPLMDYQEPDSIIDVDDYETERTYAEYQSRYNVNVYQKQKNNISSIASRPNARSLYQNVDDSMTTNVYSKGDDIEKKEPIISHANYNNLSRCFLHHKRHYNNAIYTDEDQPHAKKKRRYIQQSAEATSIQDKNCSITGLVSLFGDLVAGTDPGNQMSYECLDHRVPAIDHIL